MKKIGISCIKNVLVLLLSGLPLISQAQIERPGITWKYITDPGFKLQLQRNNPSNYHMIHFRDFVSGQEEENNYCRFTYTGDVSNYSDGVYRFVMTADTRANRSEMKVEYNNYQLNGIYQLEGEVRWIDGFPSGKEICQIWQNMDRSQNKILVYRVQTGNNGRLYVPSSQDRTGTFRTMTNVYGNYNDKNDQWLKVNVVHDRNTREVLIYLNDELYNQYTHYPASDDYYFKFGAYGKPDGASDSECIVEWRNMKFFEASSTSLVKSHMKENIEQLNIYPNPAGEQVTVSFTVESPGNVKLSVYHLNGQHIKNVSNNHYDIAGSKSIQFSTKEFKKGIYLLKLESSSNASLKKFIIQ